MIIIKNKNKNKKTTTATNRHTGSSELDLLHSFLGNNFIPRHLLSLLLFTILFIV